MIFAGEHSSSLLDVSGRLCYNLTGDIMIAVSLIDIDKKNQHSHAHRLLRECLKPFGVDYTEDSPVTKGKFGKPSLTEHPEIHYSISHADGISACIVSGKECGIDCERIRPLRPAVMRRAFSENEKQLVEEAPEEQRDTLFFRLWTLKEAYIKAVGTGLSFPLEQAEFILTEDGFTTAIDGYKFRQYIIRGEFVVSVCISLD